MVEDGNYDLATGKRANIELSLFLQVKAACYSSFREIYDAEARIGKVKMSINQGGLPYNHHIRYRGHSKVQMQCLLAATAKDMKKIALLALLYRLYMWLKAFQESHRAAVVEQKAQTMGR